MDIRNTAPTADNKYYLQRPHGYNPCILGNPQNRQYPYSVLADCTGACVGRFNELRGRDNCDLLGNAYPGYMLTLANRQGLEIWDKPAIGGVIVMLKSDNLNGHVISVEKINGGLIYTFESGWSYPKGKYIANRQISKASNWGMSSAYRWAGCIVNPDVDPYPFTMKYVNRTHNKGEGVKAVQWVLNKEKCYAPGADNKIDGICGAATINAIKKFQSKHKDLFGKPLAVDGSAGTLTQAVMKKLYSIV